MIVHRGRRVLRIEADAILGVLARLDDPAAAEGFVRAVEILRDCRRDVAGEADDRGAALAGALYAT